MSMNIFAKQSECKDLSRKVARNQKSRELKTAYQFYSLLVANDSLYRLPFSYILYLESLVLQAIHNE